jgi:hypothetical protein
MKCIRLVLQNTYLLCVLLLLPFPILAQQIVIDVPDEYEEPIEDWITLDERENSPFYKGRFADDAIAQNIKYGRILDVTRGMISAFDASDWEGHESTKQKILNRLQRFIVAMEVALNTQGIKGALDKISEQNIFLQSLNNQGFGLSSFRDETLMDGRGLDVPGFFGGTEDEIIFFENLEDGESVELLVSPAQVRLWRLLADALTNLLVEQITLVSEANIMQLKNAVVRWENVLENGYSQMPWESAINGRLIKAPEFGPPDHQFIVMHPALGLEFSVDPFDETRVKEVLHIELMGHIWYHGNQLDNFRGVSLSASLREDLDPGIGVMLHIKRNWSIGLAWHDVEEDPYLFFSVDLFRFAKGRATQYVEKYDDLREQLDVN